MHYFKHHIGDYRAETLHLKPMGHYIYRELIDEYYRQEAPISLDTKKVLRMVLRLEPDMEDELVVVLNDFFHRTEEGWEHPKIEEELRIYREKAEISRQNGMKGGRPKKQSATHPVIQKTAPQSDGNRTLRQPLTTNQEPLTTNQKPALKEPLPESDSSFVGCAEYKGDSDLCVRVNHETGEIFDDHDPTPEEIAEDLKVKEGDDDAMIFLKTGDW
ncbi:MAG: DUF1376 domain-containing protein [Candidatus Sedimenticola sp. (ex Thyasira tokunagai)]